MTRCICFRPQAAVRLVEASQTVDLGRQQKPTQKPWWPLFSKVDQLSNREYDQPYKTIGSRLLLRTQ